MVGESDEKSIKTYEFIDNKEKEVFKHMWKQLNIIQEKDTIKME